MGNVTSYAFKKAFGKKDIRVLVLRLNAAGKTTTLYQLKLAEVVSIIPTICLNNEKIGYKKLNVERLDFCGRSGIRSYYRHYFQSMDALIYILDSNDRDRFEEAADELQQLIQQKELSGIPVAVLANKQDLPNAMKAEDVNRKLTSRRSFQEQNLNVFSVCATSGDGLYEAHDWLTAMIARNKAKSYVRKTVKDNEKIMKMWR